MKRNEGRRMPKENELLGDLHPQILGDNIPLPKQEVLLKAGDVGGSAVGCGLDLN